MRAFRANRLPILAAAATTLVATGVVAPASADGWWPGGSKEKAESPAEDDESAMVDSSAFKLTWPKLEMPKFSWKGDEAEEADNSALTPEGNPISRAFDKVSESSKNAATNVRNAWGAAVDKLPFGGGDDAKVTKKKKEEKPGFFARLFSPAEEPRGSETMQEFLAQERVGTVR